MLFLETIRYVDVGERQLIWGAALESLVKSPATLDIVSKNSSVDVATATVAVAMLLLLCLFLLIAAASASDLC